MLTLPARRTSGPATGVEPAISQAGLIAGLIGPFIAVELTSGLLQGYYVPLVSQISHHLGIPKADYNWFEAVQLIVSALAVPLLSRLGDIHGHKRVFLGAAVLTALATWGMVFSGGFTSYLVTFSLQGVYAVWFPLEVALVFTALRRSGQASALSRRASGYLVVALSIGAIIGALAGAAIYDAVGHSIPTTLVVPAVATTLCCVVVFLFVAESEPQPGRSVDSRGFAALAIAMLAVMGSLSLLRLNGLGAWWAWGVMVAGVAAFYPLSRHLRRVPEPAIDLGVLLRPTMWPVQATALLSGVSVLGAQIPLSTYAAANPRRLGYGLGLSAASVSYVTGVYLVSLMVGAVTLARASGRFSPRAALFGYTAVNACGYLALIGLHGSVWEVVACLCLAGVGAGGVAASLPAVAASAAPSGQTGIATGLTNTTKMVGGALASAVFGMLLHKGGTTDGGAVATITPFLWVWGVCGGVAVVSLALLIAVPRGAFVDRAGATEVSSRPS